MPRMPITKCSYETYSRYVRKLNVSFAKLEAEQCELCIELSQAVHDMSNGECVGLCTVCRRLGAHKVNYVTARRVYQEAGKDAINGTIVRSVDLQKLIMLPRLPGIKSVYVTKRVIVFHETFAPVGAYVSVAQNLCILWHESVRK